MPVDSGSSPKVGLHAVMGAVSTKKVSPMTTVAHGHSEESGAKALCYCLTCRRLVDITGPSSVFRTGFMHQDGRDYPMGVCWRVPCPQRNAHDQQH